jgi:membrane protease YdiL (CAAX protease family)
MSATKAKLTVNGEAIAVFAVAAVLFRSLLALPLSQWETQLVPGSALRFVEYGAVIVLVLGWLAVTRRNWHSYGLTLPDPRRQLRIVTVGLLPILALSLALGQFNWREGPGALLVSGVATAVLFLLGWLLKDKNPTVPVGLLLATPLLLSLTGTILLKTVYFYLIAGPAEELLFRGYLQSRLNEAYARPYRFFGVAWGWGAILSAVLFGVWHVVLGGGGTAAWWHGLWAFFAGLIFSYLREKSGSLVAPSLLHSVMNYLPVG